MRTPLVFFEEIFILNYSKVLFWLLPENILPDHVLLRNANRFNLSGVRTDPQKRMRVKVVKIKHKIALVGLIGTTFLGYQIEFILA